MSNGFVLGTLCALTWGIADVFVTYAGRRVGFCRTLLLSQIAGVGLLVAVALVAGDLPSPSTGQLLAFAAIAPVAVAAYGGFYKALELGPIAIVSPIASANGVVIVLLAVIVLGETLGAQQAIGCALVLGFIVLASLEPAALRESKEGKSGIPLALVASTAFAGYMFCMALLSEELGWLVPALMARSMTAVLRLTIATTYRPKAPGPLERTGLVLCLCAGLLDASGYIWFSRGAEIGEVAITSAAASAYPVIPIIVGLFLLRERVAWHQLVGVAGVLAGMVVLSLG